MRNDMLKNGAHTAPEVQRTLHPKGKPMMITEIKSLPVSERIILMEEIWDSLCDEHEQVQSPLWHQEILNDRLALLNSKQATLLSLQELKNTNR
ncbi:MAG: addiction module protein [Methylovulum miyakonense]|uniref:addiction module protein n=1 Tax=Methylovulum miyakonense TaxID=645578 RepID=UPI003BB58BF6